MIQNPSKTQQQTEHTLAELTHSKINSKAGNKTNFEVMTRENFPFGMCFQDSLYLPVHPWSLPAVFTVYMSIV